jgi:superfamily II helicase
MQDRTDEETKELFLQFCKKTLFPYCRREDYIKKLSTAKIIRLAERIICPNIPCYTATEAIYNEMIKRLLKTAKNEQLIARIMKETETNADDLSSQT